MHETTISVNEQLEVDAARLVVLMMFDIAHPQLAPNLSTQTTTQYA